MTFPSVRSRHRASSASDVEAVSEVPGWETYESIEPDVRETAVEPAPEPGDGGVWPETERRCSCSRRILENQHQDHFADP
jgi:hypothetical protein